MFQFASCGKMRHKVLLIVLLCACCGLGLATIALNDDTGHKNHNDPSPSSLVTSWYQTRSSSMVGKSKLSLWPLDYVDLAMFVIIGVCLSLAGGAGIGGGAILVPIYIMLRGWPTNIAVAMSNVTVLGGSLANFLCNVRRHRHNGTRTIDWELILMMEPTTIAGALFGAILNKLLPNYITTYLLTALLTFMAIRLYQKACQTYTKETALLKAAKHAAKAAARHAADQHPQQQLQLQDHGQAVKITGMALKTRGSNSTSSSKGIARSLSRTISKSITRLSGPMLLQVQGSAHHAGQSPRFDTGSFNQAQLHAAIASSRGSYSSRHGSVLRLGHGDPAAVAAGTTAAAAAAVAAETAEQHAGTAWLPGVLSSDAFDVSTLCQGDGVGDAIEPLVVLPLDPTFSSDDSEHSTASDDVNAEDCNYADEENQGDFRSNEDELLRPLLTSSEARAGEGGGFSDTAMNVSDVTFRKRDVDDAAVSAKDWSTADGTSQGAALRPADPAIEPCVPVPHLLALLVLSAWVIISDTLQHSTRCGSWQYWVVTLSVLAPVVVILLVFRQVLLRKYKHDDLAPGTVLPDGQLHWTRKTTLLYPVLCSSAGLIAGLFGIGGGVVKGPLMLELGVPADVAAATSATMIMFTAGSACVVYSRFGQILLDYGAVLATFGFCTTLCSQLLTFILIRLLGRRSVIVFMMVTLMSIACSIMYVQSVFVTQEIVQHPEELTRFGHLCPAGGSGVGHVLKQLLLSSFKTQP